MADTIWLRSGFDTTEADDLRGIAMMMSVMRGSLSQTIAASLAEFDREIAAASPSEAERAAEKFARVLRALWLNAAGREASTVYRSPTEAQTRSLARKHDDFGYERDLQPQSLERRCAIFFPKPPPGWRQDHILFSSGQSAMTCALLALTQRLGPRGEKLRLMHRGCYFETTQLVGTLSQLSKTTSIEAADIIIEEPVSCDGHFHQHDTEQLQSASPGAVIFDTTLLGRDDGIADYLAKRNPEGNDIVIRVTSCLKLMQSGLELANAGILSVYNRDGDRTVSEAVRSLRTLTGAGLHLVDALALEHPAIFNDVSTDAYTAHIFRHNAHLARTVDQVNRRFAPITHPALDGGAAPFCVFQLKDASPAAYAALSDEIESEARARQINLMKGGSFGFRGHRFEIVTPDTEDPPFLRIALGRRGGWSCDGIIRMMAEIAGRE